MPVLPEPIEARFWRFTLVCEHGRECADCCHVWQGHRNRYNYGVMRLCANVRKASGMATSLAHRIAWQLRHGPILYTQHVCHACDNPPCVNVQHLWLGDPQANHADAVAKGRVLVGVRHPMRLHPERAARGERNGSRKYIEKMPRGEASSSAKVTASDVSAIRLYVRLGYTHAQLAEAYAVHESNISSIVRRKTWAHVPDDFPLQQHLLLGDPWPSKQRRGEEATGAKLTASEIPIIRQRAEAGIPYAILAADYNVSRALICLIATRQIWRHVPEKEQS